jgi:hypothetical protein
MYLWWVGSRPTAPTPKLEDQDFLSGLYPLAFGVTTPLLQGNKICNPRQGPLQGAISRSQLNPGFFSRLLLLPLLLSQPGLGPAMAEFESSFYGTRRLITVFKRAHHWFISWAKWIQSIPLHHISLISILILFSYPHLGSPRRLLTSCFPIKILYALLLSSTHATYPAHLILLDFILQLCLARSTFLEDVWGGARRGLLKSSSLSQEGGVVQLALRGT